MAITTTVYGNAALGLARGDIDFDTATVKVLLLNNTYLLDKDIHAFRSDLTGEITGAGYTAGGATVGTITTVYDAANDRAQVDGADVTWTALSATFRYAVMYLDTGTPTTSRLLQCMDFGADTTVNGDTTLQWASTGFLHLTAA